MKKEYVCSLVSSPSEFQIMRHKSRIFLERKESSNAEVTQGHLIEMKDLESQKIIGGTYLVIYQEVVSIDVFWVDSEYERKGLGRRLFSEIKNFALAHQCKVLVGTSYEPDQSLNFWKKLGCTVFGEISDLGEGKNIYYLKYIVV